MNIEKLKERSGSIGEKFLLMGIIALFFEQFKEVSIWIGIIAIVTGASLILYSISEQET